MSLTVLLLTWILVLMVGALIGAWKGEGGEGRGLGGGKEERKVVPGSWSELVETLQLADEHAQSWMAWEYKPFQPITGANYGLFQPDGSLHPLVVQFFWRTYPVAVAGTVQQYRFDPYSSNFSMTYTAGGVTVGESGGGGESDNESDIFGAWVGVLVRGVRGALRGGHGGRERSQGSSGESAEGRYSDTAGGYSDTGKAFSDTAEDDYSDTEEGRRGRRRMQGNSDRSEKVSLRSVTEIHVCCNRDMEVRVEQPGVEVHKSEGGSVVQLWHRPQHAGKAVTVRIYPRDL